MAERPTPVTAVSIRSDEAIDTLFQQKLTELRRKTGHLRDPPDRSSTATPVQGQEDLLLPPTTFEGYRALTPSANQLRSSNSTPSQGTGLQKLAHTSRTSRRAQSSTRASLNLESHSSVNHQRSVREPWSAIVRPREDVDQLFDQKIHELRQQTRDNHESRKLQNRGLGREAITADFSLSTNQTHEVAAGLNDGNEELWYLGNDGRKEEQRDQAMAQPARTPSFPYRITPFNGEMHEQRQKEATSKTLDRPSSSKREESRQRRRNERRQPDEMPGTYSVPVTPISSDHDLVPDTPGLPETPMTDVSFTSYQTANTEASESRTPGFPVPQDWLGPKRHDLGGTSAEDFGLVETSEQPHTQLDKTRRKAKSNAKLNPTFVEEDESRDASVSVTLQQTFLATKSDKPTAKEDRSAGHREPDGDRVHHRQAAAKRAIAPDSLRLNDSSNNATAHLANALTERDHSSSEYATDDVQTQGDTRDENGIASRPRESDRSFQRNIDTLNERYREGLRSSRSRGVRTPTNQRSRDKGRLRTTDEPATPHSIVTERSVDVMINKNRTSLREGSRSNGRQTPASVSVRSGSASKQNSQNPYDSTATDTSMEDSPDNASRKMARGFHSSGPIELILSSKADSIASRRGRSRNRDLVVSDEANDQSSEQERVNGVDYTGHPRTVNSSIRRPLRDASAASYQSSREGNSFAVGCLSSSRKHAAGDSRESSTRRMPPQYADQDPAQVCFEDLHEVIRAKMEMRARLRARTRSTSRSNDALQHVEQHKGLEETTSDLRGSKVSSTVMAKDAEESKAVGSLPSRQIQTIRGFADLERIRPAISLAKDDGVPLKAFNWRQSLDSEYDQGDSRNTDRDQRWHRERQKILQQCHEELKNLCHELEEDARREEKERQRYNQEDATYQLWLQECAKVSLKENEELQARTFSDPWNKQNAYLWKLKKDEIRQRVGDGLRQREMNRLLGELETKSAADKARAQHMRQEAKVETARMTRQADKLRNMAKAQITELAKRQKELARRGRSRKEIRNDSKVLLWTDQLEVYREVTVSMLAGAENRLQQMKAADKDRLSSFYEEEKLVFRLRCNVEKSRKQEEALEKDRLDEQSAWGLTAASKSNDQDMEATLANLDRPADRKSTLSTSAPSQASKFSAQLALNDHQALPGTRERMTERFIRGQALKSATYDPHSNSPRTPLFTKQMVLPDSGSDTSEPTRTSLAKLEINTKIPFGVALSSIAENKDEETVISRRAEVVPWDPNPLDEIGEIPILNGSELSKSSSGSDFSKSKD